jgi:diadenosine tetraphosphatase ApaH/serine/threonine PP2A family protein phosphatase
MTLPREIFIGDVHACASELGRLLDKVGLTSTDRVYLTGDLCNRGPNFLGLLALIQEVQAEAVMGNHDWAVVRHFEGKKSLPRIAGPTAKLLKKNPQALVYLRDLPFYRRTQHGDIVHAGLKLGLALEDQPPEALTEIRTPWYKNYQEERLVLFGHRVMKQPLIQQWKGQPVAVGLDTGCVYGGRLTALVMPEFQFYSVAARRNYG